MLILAGGDDQDGSSVGAPAHALRFNYADTPYLSFTPGGAPTSSRIFTIAGWFRKTVNDEVMVILDAFTGSINHDMLCTSFSGDANRIQFEAVNTNNMNLVTTAKLKDPGGWYHLCIGVDTTQATPANRVTIEINAAAQAALDLASYPALNYDFLYFGASGVPQEIGRFSSSSKYADGYMADLYYIDGQKKQASDFIQIDGSGRLIAMPYGGTYGANGWHLDFADTSAATSGALGKDTSGNGHNFTPTNFSVSAGVGNDGLNESPADYDDGTAHGCFAVFSNLGSVGGPTLANGSLEVSSFSSKCAIATQTMRSGKFVMEITGAGPDCAIGVVDTAKAHPTLSNNYPGGSGYGAAGSYGYIGTTGNQSANGSTSAYGATYTTTDTIRAEFDADNGVLEFFKNNASQGQISGITTGKSWAFAVGSTGASPGAPKANFGARAFANTPTAGFNGVSTGKIPDAETPITSGSFVGNASSSGPVVDLGGAPTALTINGNAVTWGTHALKLAGGAKIITSSVSYNASGTNTFTATVPITRKHARAQIN